MRTLLIAFCSALCGLVVAGPAFARDDGGLDAGCAIDWTARLQDRTIYGHDLLDGSKFTEFLTSAGRAIWTMSTIDVIYDDQWHIEQCDRLCWTLQDYEDWCSRIVETSVGFDVFDTNSGDQLFEVIIAGQGDMANMEQRLQASGR